MAGGSSKIKITPPPKLDSKSLTLDKLQTWYSGMRNCFKHDPDHKLFLKGQKYENWTALKTDKNRGISIEPIHQVGDDNPARRQNETTAQAESEKIREHLEDFLHLLASKAPDGMYNTITRQATSMEWVYMRIKTAFRIQSKGADLFNATEAVYDEDKDASYDVSYMKMKDLFEDLLSPAATKYHGEPLDTDEALTPLAESMITIQWLRSIHPDLPKHIKDRHSNLFTAEKPNWADLQPDFVKQMDILLTEIEGKGDEDPRIGRLGTSYRGRGRGRGRGGAPRGMGRGRDNLQQPSYSGQNRFCDICHAAGKPESIVNSHNMPWCKALSTQGKKSIVSSLRMAFVGETEDYSEDAVAEDEFDESVNPYENI